MSVKNLVQCLLITPVSSTATELLLGTVTAPYSLPPLDGGVLALVDSPAKPSFYEIITYTHRTDNVLYGVVRGQEGTTARAWSGVTYVYQSLTANQYETDLAKKVDKVSGKGLSTNDLTGALLTKLNGISAGAQANVATNLAQGTRTTTTVLVTSSTGNNATLSSATTTQAGLMSAADKVTLGGRAGLSVAQTFTARQTFGAGVVEKAVAVAAANIDLSAGSIFSKTITGATSFTLSNVPVSGSAVSFILSLVNGGAATVTWWANIKWPADTPPTLTEVGRDVIGFYTTDGGTSWTGFPQLGYAV